MSRQPKIKIGCHRRSNEVLDLGTKIETGRVTLTLPIKTVSEGNCSEHWTKKSKRHKSQQKHIWIAWQPIKKIVALPCVITLTRYAPGTLDKQDNLPYSMKWIVDAIAAEITGDYRYGRADSTDLIDWFYAQEKSSFYAIKISIELKSISRLS